MSERNYFCLCEDNCLFPTMTSEQIMAAIAEATGSVPTEIDDAFITKLKEQNGQTAFKIWVGTEAQYNAITTKANDVLYFIKEIGQPVRVAAQEVITDYNDLENLPNIPRIITSGTAAPTAGTAGHGTVGSLYFKIIE